MKPYALLSASTYNDYTWILEEDGQLYHSEWNFSPVIALTAARNDSCPQQLYVTIDELLAAPGSAADLFICYYTEDWQQRHPELFI